MKQLLFILILFLSSCYVTDISSTIGDPKDETTTAIIESIDSNSMVSYHNNYMYAIDKETGLVEAKGIMGYRDTVPVYVLLLAIFLVGALIIGVIIGVILTE